jgi:hypothetical protein
MIKSNLKALNAYFRAKSLTYFELRNVQFLVNFEILAKIVSGFFIHFQIILIYRSEN